MMGCKNKAEPQIILQVNTPAELETRLKALNIRVPARGDGRKSHHVERYCVAHLLATLPIIRFSFPLTLIHSDKPDFVLAMSQGDVGIEHTEAVHENDARADVMRGNSSGKKVYYIRRATLGEPRKTDTELMREIKADASGDGWFGKSAEREWADAMAFYIKKKLPKAMADGFVRYPENWLIVYNNWRLPSIDSELAASYLVPHLADMEAFSVFNTIFVLNNLNLKMCEFRRDCSEVHERDSFWNE